MKTNCKIINIIISALIGILLMSMYTQAKEQNPVPIMGTIYMVTLHTDNFSKMKNFYNKKLGMKIINDTGEFIELSSQGLRLSIVSRKSLNKFIPAKTLQIIRQGSSVGIGFKYSSTKEVDKAFVKLSSNNVKFIAKPTMQPWGEYTAFFSDPDGNIHELVYYDKK